MHVAVIREEECIGCNKCVTACPFDAIVGAFGKMHTVLLDECVGCKLCIEPCPVDCIETRSIAQNLSAEEYKNKALKAKSRFQARAVRLQKNAAPQLMHYANLEEHTDKIKSELKEILARKNKNNSNPDATK
jgi:electron transport complex protein RnfB